MEGPEPIPYKEKTPLECWQDRHDNNIAWLTIWRRLFWLCQIIGWVMFIFVNPVGRAIDPVLVAWGLSLLFGIGLWVCLFKDRKYHEEKEFL